jgi:hypothetical protein
MKVEVLLVEVLNVSEEVVFGSGALDNVEESLEVLLFV